MEVAGRNKSREEEEREMADFLSSIEDDITRSESGPSQENVTLSMGGDLFFGPTSSLSPAKYDMKPYATASSSRALGRGRGPETAPDWLQDFQALEVGASARSRAAASSTTSGENNGRREYGEVPGAEPEILDEDFLPLQSGRAIAGRKSSALAGKHAARDSTPARRDPKGWIPNDDSRVAAPMRPGGYPRKNIGTAIPSSAGGSQDKQERLDWPGTMDMLGVPESEASAGSDGRPAEGSGHATGLRKAGSTTAPAPAPLQGGEASPDFVEVRDPRLVSQWPKPSAPASVGGAGAGAGAGTGGTTGVAGQGAPAGSAGKHAGLPPPLRTVEMYLRPDVTWESVSDVYMAVMLSRGLVVREQTEKMVRLGLWLGPHESEDLSSLSA